VNAPESIVLSGRLEALRAVEERLKTDGITGKPLTVSHGFHSAQMDTMADQFAQLTRSVTVHQPRMRVVSSVTGEFVDAAALADPQYWRRQVRQPVEFYAAMQTLEKAGYDTFLEIGPTATLAGLGRQCITNPKVTWVPSLRKDRGAWEQMLDSLGTLYVNGASTQWDGFDAPYARHRVVLPSYPFQRQRYWMDQAPRPKHISTTGHPFLGARSEIAGPSPVSVWETQVSFETFPYLTDHRVQGDAVVPATAYLEMAIAAGHEMLGDGPIAATNLTFHKPLFLTDAASARVQVSYEASSGAVRVHSRMAPTGPWTLHASGHVSRAEPHDGTVRAPEQLPQTRREMASSDFYTFFEKLGNQWGPTFQGVEHAWIDQDEAWGRVTIPAALRSEVGRYYTHPAVADASGHVLAALTAPETADSGGAFVGHSIDRVTVYARPRGTQLLAYARVTPTDNPHLRRGDVRVFDADGTLLSDLSGAQLHYLDAAQQEAPSTASDSWFYQLEWHDAPVVESGTVSSAPSNWVMLTNGDSSSQLATALMTRMQASGAHGHVVGDQSTEALRKAVAEHAGAAILDLRHLDTNPPSAARDAGATNSTDVVTESASLLALTQALASGNAGAKPARVWIATRGVHPIGNVVPDAKAVRQAPLWGLGRTLSVEHPELYGGLIDLDPNAAAGTTADLLWVHLGAADGEDQVALRGDRRYVARLERYRPKSTASHGTLALRPDGAYVVTGGLGGLGLAVAKWLVASGARRLVLVGRTPLPARTQWTTLAADHPQAKTVGAVRALEAAGATVHIASFDVGDANAVSAWYEAYKNEAWPPIRGVVHAAGVLRHETLLELTSATLAELMRPKVGVWNLHTALADAPLDFFVLFSSASALLSSPKLGAYAAGNAFLDTFAAYRRALGRPALSIDWGVWGEAGMAAQFDTDSLKTLADRGMGAMRTAQGLDALGRLIGDTSASAQVAVLPVNWARWAELFPSYTKAPLLTDIFKETASTAQGTTAASTSNGRAHGVLDASDAERPERLRTYLVTTLGSILGFGAADVDPTLPISSLGLDSLTAVELKNRIEADLAVSLPTVRFLQGPALAELAAEIEPLLVTIHDTATPAASSSDTIDVDAMSNDEVDAALAALLNGG
jgi:acyl transferase domain-containing protein